MAGVHQRLQILGPPVAAFRRVEQHPVVSPAARARELGHRHQLDRGDAQINEVVEPALHARIGALGGEGADVQLVEDEALRRQARPLRVPPGVGERIDHLAGPVHVAGLVPRGRIGDQQLAVDAIAVAGPGRRVARRVLGPAARVARHRHRARRRLQPKLDAPGAGRPEAEARAAVVGHGGAEGHAVHPADDRGVAHRGDSTRSSSATGKWPRSAPTGNPGRPSRCAAVTVTPVRRSR